MKYFLIAGLIFSSTLRAEAHHHEMEMPGAAAQKLSGESLYNLNSEWTDQGDHKIKLSQFRGQPVILVMLYTSCKAACPVLIADVQKIEADLSAAQRRQVRFVVVTMDPARDTVAALKKFAEAHHLDPASWTLLRGSEGQVRELANAIGMKIKKTDGGNYSHSNIISTLDKEGLVRHQQLGLGTDDKETLAVLTGFLTR